jgi:hypothetical protein
LSTTADNKNKPFKLSFKGLVFVYEQNLLKIKKGKNLFVFCFKIIIDY